LFITPMLHTKLPQAVSVESGRSVFPGFAKEPAAAKTLANLSGWIGDLMEEGEVTFDEIAVARLFTIKDIVRGDLKVEQMNENTVTPEIRPHR